MTKTTAIVVAALTALVVSSARADDAAMVTYKSLTPEVALQAAQAAMKTCRDNGYQISVAVVDRFGRLSLADDELRLDVGCEGVHAFGGGGKALPRLVHRLGAHHLLDAAPVLEVARRNDIEQHQPPRRMSCARGCVDQRPVAFGRVVDDAEELASVTLFAGEAA